MEFNVLVWPDFFVLGRCCCVISEDIINRLPPPQFRSSEQIILCISSADSFRRHDGPDFFY